MKHLIFTNKTVSVTPLRIAMHVPPVNWKGDRVGHIGKYDTFFWILEGECYVNIDSQYYVARPGQMVYLPQGKMRSYSHASETISMYEMAFSATVDGENLMEALNLTDSDFVVDILPREEVTVLFEHSSRVEMHKDPVYDLGWCANLINIIRLYAEAHQKQNEPAAKRFAPVLNYMSEHLSSPVNVATLADLVHMQPTYFTHRFKDTYGIPPMAYLGKLRLHKAMELLNLTNHSVEEIAGLVGIPDSAYFARFFKKHCGVTPSEYRRVFRQE